MQNSARISRKTQGAPMTGMQTRSHFAGDARQWVASSILAASVLEPLHELNRSWLALLAMGPHCWSMREADSRLPDPVGAGLMSLSPEQRAEIARCPFSLFTARFNDSAYWLGIAGNRQVHEPTSDGRGQNAVAGLGEFAELALFFAWHLVRANPPSAKIVLGMSDQTIAVFASLQLSSLQQLAHRPGALITSRWPHRTSFWLRLLGSIGREDQGGEVRTLGLQMLAAELATPVPAEPRAP
jgi:hypothetical protein